MKEKALKVALAILVFTYLVNFIFLGFFIGPFDYDHLSAYYELAWRFWVQSPGLPHFNPFLCGGRTLGGDPQIPIFHPLVIFIPILGATWTIKLELLAQIFLGTWGLHRWLLNWKVERTGCLWGVFLFLSGGGVVAKALVGHVTLGSYLLLPLFFLLSYRLAEKERDFSKREILSYWLLFIYSGFYKPNFLIYVVPVLLIEVLARTLLTQKFWALGQFIFAVGISTVCNAISELPALSYFLAFPERKDTVAAYYTPLYTLLFNLLMPLKSIPKIFYGPGFFMQRHEYSFFLGPMALYFTFLGLKSLKSRRPELLALFVFIFFSAALGVGSIEDGLSPWFIFTWLKPFWPGFQSIRVPPRFWFGVFLGLIIFSALGFSKGLKKIPSTIFVFLGVLPLLLSAVINLSKTSIHATQTQWTTPRLYPDRFTQVLGDETRIYSIIRQGKGSIKCVPNLSVFESASLVEGDTLLSTGTRPHTTDLAWLSWNKIRVKTAATVSAPFQLSLNINASPYWSFEGEGELKYQRGAPLTLSSRNGHLNGHLVFLQPWVGESLIISLAGWLFLLLFAFYYKRKLK